MDIVRIRKDYSTFIEKWEMLFIKKPHEKIQKHRVAHPCQVRDKKKTREFFNFIKLDNQRKNYQPEHDDNNKRKQNFMKPKKNNGPKRVEYKMDDE